MVVQACHYSFSLSLSLYISLYFSHTDIRLKFSTKRVTVFSPRPFPPPYSDSLNACRRLLRFFFASSHILSHARMHFRFPRAFRAHTRIDPALVRANTNVCRSRTDPSLAPSLASPTDKSHATWLSATDCAPPTSPDTRCRRSTRSTSLAVASPARHARTVRERCSCDRSIVDPSCRCSSRDRKTPSTRRDSRRCDRLLEHCTRSNLS